MRGRQRTVLTVFEIGSYKEPFSFTLSVTRDALHRLALVHWPTNHTASAHARIPRCYKDGFQNTSVERMPCIALRDRRCRYIRFHSLRSAYLGFPFCSSRFQVAQQGKHEKWKLSGEEIGGPSGSLYEKAMPIGRLGHGLHWVVIEENT